jgi:hypothetical protein
VQVVHRVIKPATAHTGEVYMDLLQARRVRCVPSAWRVR